MIEVLHWRLLRGMVDLWISWVGGQVNCHQEWLVEKECQVLMKLVAKWILAGGVVGGEVGEGGRKIGNSG